jgi:hypothetical protein
MSMTLLVVLTLNRAPDFEAWQRAMTESHVPVQFSGKTDLREHSGFVPLTVHGSDSGFFFLHDDLADLSRLYTPLSRLKVERPVVYSFGWGGHGLECAAALYSASVLVGSFGGVAFDPQGGQFMSEQTLRETAHACMEIDDL